MARQFNILKAKLEELPNNIEAEQSVIGSILLSNEYLSIDNISAGQSEINSNSPFLALRSMFWLQISSILFITGMKFSLSGKRFQDSYPNIEVISYVGTSESQIKSYEADVTILTTRYPPQDMVAKKIGTTEMHIYGSKNYLKDKEVDGLFKRLGKYYKDGETILNGEKYGIFELWLSKPLLPINCSSTRDEYKLNFPYLSLIS